jgi:hypothetical protein
MSLTETLQANLLSPLILAFALGLIAKLLRTDLALPKDLYTSLSIYLLFALGLKGGVELTHASWDQIAWPALVTVVLGCVTPVSAYLVLRRLGRFNNFDAAGIAAHYGSVSAVTFIAAQQFVTASGTPAEGFMPTLLTLMESPGIAMALAIGSIQAIRQAAPATQVVTTSGGAAVLGNPDEFEMGGLAESTRRVQDVLWEVVTGRTMVLLVGGMLIGYLTGSKGYEPVKPFFETGFRGALTIFLLEMGLTAGERLGDLRKSGLFLIGFAIVVPIVHGLIGVSLGTLAGLGIGGSAVLGTMAASASYIAAPPAVRMALPEANPTYSLTAALAITFPFNLVAGIPLYYVLAQWLAR